MAKTDEELQQWAEGEAVRLISCWGKHTCSLGRVHRFYHHPTCAAYYREDVATALLAARKLGAEEESGACAEAAEFGFRCAEKGMNLEATRAKLSELLQGASNE